MEGTEKSVKARVHSEEPRKVGPRHPQRGARPQQDRHRERGKGHSWGLALGAEPGAVAGRPMSSKLCRISNTRLKNLRCTLQAVAKLSGKKVAIICKVSKKTSERKKKKQTQIKQRGEEIGDERGII